MISTGTCSGQDNAAAANTLYSVAVILGLDELKRAAVLITSLKSRSFLTVERTRGSIIRKAALLITNASTTVVKWLKSGATTTVIQAL